VRSGQQILSNVVASQIATHQPYGGVVPELASREHLRAIVPVVRQALAEAGQTYQSVDAIAVTQGPGLAGALLVGISYSWWMTKHSRHHANPNIIGKDPDIERDYVSFIESDAAKAKGLYAWFTKRQGYFFFPILMGEGLNLHIRGLSTVFGKGKVEKRWLEAPMLVARISIYVAGMFLLLPPGMAFAFIGVQLAVFGVYMGASFAPNHKGMPILPHDSKVDFLRRQVLTSRNIRSGWFMNFYMGGLNHQVEHHLFPNMPRPHLKRAQVIAKEYCRTHNIDYTETTIWQSYAIVIRYLNKVGLAAGGDPFDCPAATSFGR